MMNQAYRGYIARKRFGQNFLKDRFIIDSIVSAINPQKGQAIIEIGPGLAALTKPVCEHLDELTVIEIDYELVAWLKMHPLLKNKLNIYQQDVMMMNFIELAAKINKPLRLFGSLPYNISTQLMFYLFSCIDTIVDMHFILQKEVVDRLTATPNSKAYGRLSIMAQYFCNIIKVLEVPASCFYPLPKINSTMVRLIPHKTKPYLVKDMNILRLITTEAFNKRRKIISNSLNNLFDTKILVNLDINPMVRAENVSIEQYCKLANYISDHTLMQES